MKLNLFKHSFEKKSQSTRVNYLTNNEKLPKKKKNPHTFSQRKTKIVIRLRINSSINLCLKKETLKLSIWTPKFGIIFQFFGIFCFENQTWCSSIKYFRNYAHIWIGAVDTFYDQSDSVWCIFNKTLKKYQANKFFK